MTSTVVQNWLRQNVQSYPRHERVYADVDAALSAYAALKVKTDVYSEYVRSPNFVSGAY
jgi:ESCRT-I complex subunit TSG101